MSPDRSGAAPPAGHRIDNPLSGEQIVIRAGAGDTAVLDWELVLAPGGRFVAIERHVAAGAHGLASHGWTRAQADAFRARCEAFHLSATVAEHQEGNWGAALSVVAFAPAT